jgi:hypothetical protein
MDVDMAYKVLRTGPLWHKNPPLWRELLTRVDDKSLDSWLTTYDAVFVKGPVDSKLLGHKIEFNTTAGYAEFCLKWLD